jgi:hypothetical protein
VGDRSYGRFATPISLYTIVARTEGYTYDAKVWDLSIIQGPCRPVLNPNRPIRSFCTSPYESCGCG